MSIVEASFAVVIVGDTRVPKVSLSNHTHIDALCPFRCVSVHAASPPSDPGGAAVAPAYVCSKLAMEALGSAPDSLPPTNMNICVFAASAPDVMLPIW